MLLSWDMCHALAIIGVVMAPQKLWIVVTRLIAPLRRQVGEVVGAIDHVDAACVRRIGVEHLPVLVLVEHADPFTIGHPGVAKRVVDRKSTRLNSSHGYISYAVFCLKKKKN